jgi:hypothetical protein
MAHQLQLGIKVKNVYFVAHSASTLVFAGEKPSTAGRLMVLRSSFAFWHEWLRSVDTKEACWCDLLIVA